VEGHLAREFQAHDARATSDCDTTDLLTWRRNKGKKVAIPPIPTSRVLMNGSERLPLALQDNLVIRQLDDETLVYDLDRDEAHCLNHTAALIWKQCDGKTSVAQAARLLKQELGTNVDADLVWLGINQLRRFHLVEPKKKGPAVSRRDLVLKYAPAALALPIVFSIIVPRVVDAASCGGPGAPCGGSNPPCCPGCGCDGICFCG